MLIERKAFFDVVRPALHPKGMKQSVVDGYNLLLESWEQRYQDRTPLTQFANVLATAYHETAFTMQPIHEYGNREYFMRMYDKTGARPAKAAELGNTEVGDGAKFAGQGYPQLTGRANYRRATRELRKLGIIGEDVDFERDPHLVMLPKYAIPIMFEGMENGWFTGVSLDKAIDAEIDGDEFADFVNARRIINGTDKAQAIAGYSQSYLKALKNAVRPGEPRPIPVPVPKPEVQPEPEVVIKPKPPAAPEKPMVVPTAEEPAPKGWFANLLDLMRSHRKTG